MIVWLFSVFNGSYTHVILPSFSWTRKTESVWYLQEIQVHATRGFKGKKMIFGFEKLSDKLVVPSERQCCTVDSVSNLLSVGWMFKPHQCSCCFLHQMYLDNNNMPSLFNSLYWNEDFIANAKFHYCNLKILEIVIYNIGHEQCHVIKTHLYIVVLFTVIHILPYRTIFKVSAWMNEFESKKYSSIVWSIL